MGTILPRWDKLSNIVYFKIYLSRVSRKSDFDIVEGVVFSSILSSRQSASKFERNMQFCAFSNLLCPGKFALNI